MQQVQKAVIQKDQLLVDFLAFKAWVRQYWHFLEQLPLDVFSDDEAVVEHLRDQHHKFVEARLKLQTIEMVGATLTFALARIDKQQLVFHLPVEEENAPPDYQEIVELSQQAQQLEQSLQRVVDQVLYLSRHLPPDSEEKLNPLLQAIASLFKAIIRQDGDDMKVQLSQINLLSATKDSYLLVHEVGKITREIYNSLQDFSKSLDTEDIKHATDEMPDAVQKLNSVIEKLEDATNDNLEFLESLLQQCSENIELTDNLILAFDQLDEKLAAFEGVHPELGKELQPMKQHLQEEMRKRVDQLLKRFHENENLFLTIMTNQGFQDLTGQTLKKIIDFIEHLELRLLELIQNYSESEKAAGGPSTTTEADGDFLTRVDYGVEEEEIKLHGPDETENKKSTQNDVDSLLAELGF